MPVGGREAWGVRGNGPRLQPADQPLRIMSVI